MEWVEAVLHHTVVSTLNAVHYICGVLGVLVFLAYVSLVWLVRGRSLGGPRRVPRAVRVAYNVAQSLISLAYTTALLFAVADRVQRVGWLGAACAPLDWKFSKNRTGEDVYLHFLYGANVFMRMADFVDTLLIVDSGAGVTFLHAYHHVATFLLVSVQYADKTPFAWLTLLVNGGVHVLMYAYYALCSAGQRPPWKRFVTRLQIAQFVLILAAYGAATLGVALGVFECYATPRAQWSALLVLSSYLVLFWRFERATYAEARPKTA